MSISNVIPFRGFDFVSASNPTATTNPKVPFQVWLNTTTGVMWVCTDNTTDANVWRSQSQTMYSARVSLASAYAIPTSVNHLIVWDTEVYDDKDMVDIGAQPTRITIPAGCDRAIVTANAGTNSFSASVYYGIQKNGTALFDERTQWYGNLSASWSGEVVAGDYFDFYIYSTTAQNITKGSLTVTCWHSGIIS